MRQDRDDTRNKAIGFEVVFGPRGAALVVRPRRDGAQHADNMSRQTNYLRLKNTEARANRNLEEKEQVMSRVIAFEIAGFGKPVLATLLDAEQPEFAEKVWQDLKVPLKMWPWHTTSTGDWFGARSRPALHPQASGTQAVPMGKVKLMCDVEQGSIVYAGSKIFSFAYGPDVTEPLPARGPVVARANDLDTFYRAGLRVWDAQYRTHKLVLITARRQEI